jgi:NAD(P)-dependent dehydrogenase (short-subunit alcohol dehydrogenase family)
MKNIKSALITGANKSIGFETVRQLLQNGYYVYLGSRDLQKGLEAVKQLNAEGLKEVEAVEIDVSNQESVQAARVTIGKNVDTGPW